MLYKEYPESTMFKLPAFKDPRVMQFIKTDYHVAHDQIVAQQSAMPDLRAIADTNLRLALELMAKQLQEANAHSQRLESMLERRTAAFSPAKSFSSQTYQQAVRCRF